jgi:TorA maturation chaperone TorD
MDTPTLELAPMIARRDLWLLVSVGFVQPYNRPRFDLLRDGTFRQATIRAAALLAEGPILEFGPGEMSPKDLSPEGFFAALDAEDRSLETLSHQLFGLTAISGQCPPCEVEYEPNTDVFYRCQRLADVSGFYRAFGLAVSADVGERLDHVTVEAEFLYILLAKEVAALCEGNQEGAEICRDARRKFFQEHVGWWLPTFAWLLSRVAPTGYYCHLAGLIARLSALERVSLELPPFTARVIPKPSATETDAACSSFVLPSQA